VRLAFLALLLLSAPARADTELPTIASVFRPTLRITDTGFRTLERVTVERGEVTWVTLHYVARPHRGRRWRQAAVESTLELPVGVRVLGLAIGEEAHLAWGAPVDALAARRAVTDAEIAGLAVVEQTGASAGVRHVRLRADAGDADITLALAAVDPTALAIDTGAELLVDGQAAPRGAIVDVPGAIDAASRGQALDGDTALVAGTPVLRAGVIVDRFGTSVILSGSLDKQIIRRTVQDHTPQLRQCYLARAQVQRDLAGTVVLHFAIAEGGQVLEASVDGELRDAALDACLVEQVRAWEFPPARGEGLVLVNYPLTFAVRA
jgi:TonB family protein